MIRIINLFEKSITPENILKVNKVSFLTTFLRGSSFYEDFIEIKNNFPEYLKDLKFKESWIDSNRLTRFINENQILLTNNKKIIIGEIDFKDENVRFARFSHNGMFSSLDNLICYKGEVYRGSVPRTEIKNLSYKEFEMDLYFSLESIDRKIKLDINGHKYTSSCDITFSNNNFEIKIFFNGDIIGRNIEDFQIMKREKKLSSDEFETHTVDEAFVKRNLDKLISISEYYYELRKNDYKKDCLDTYLKIFDIVKEIL